MSLVWINGQLVDKSEARVSPFDHGFLYGDGAWAHFRAFNGELFRPEHALGMLYHTLSHQLGIELNLTLLELKAAIVATVRANNRSEGYIRVIVTRGSGTLGPDPRKLDPQVIIIAEEYQPFPRELYESGLEVTFTNSVLDPGFIYHGTTLGQFHLVLAKRAALQAGCLESILLYRDQVVRCTEGSLFVVRGGKVVSTSIGYELEFGLVFQLAESLRVPVEMDLGVGWQSNKLQDLYSADEVFLAGTTCGIIGVIRVADTAIGSGTEGPITRRIRAAYRKLTRGEGIE